MRKSRLLGAVCAYIFIFSTFELPIAHGAILFSQTPTINGGITSDEDAAQFIYAGFSLSNDSNLQSVTWRGEYMPVVDGIVNTDNFTFAIYQDTGMSGPSGLGSWILQYGAGNFVNRIDTGIDDFGRDLFEYSIELSGGLALSSGDYWLAIANDTAGDDDLWAWATYSVASSPEILIGNALNYADSTSTTNEMYFSLKGTTVPIPPALWLFGSGLLGLIGMVKKKAA